MRGEHADPAEVDYYEFKPLKGEVDLKAYLPGEDMDSDIAAAVQQAHVDMAEVLEPPAKDTPEMEWPYHIGSDGEFSRPEIAERWAADIMKGRGPARHDSFSIGVLSRLGHEFGPKE